MGTSLSLKYLPVIRRKSPKIMPLDLEKFLVETYHLSTVELGAFMRCMMHFWMHGSLPEDGEQLTKIMRISGEKIDASCIASCITSCILDASSGYRRVREECIAKRQKRHEICVNAAHARWEKARRIKEQTKRESDDASCMHHASEKERFPRTLSKETNPHLGGEQSVATLLPTPNPPMGETQAKEEVKAKPVEIDSRDTAGNREDVTVQNNASASAYPAQRSTAGHFNEGLKPDSDPFDRDARYRRFQEEVERFWKTVNPGQPDCPWIRADRRALNELLAGSPNLQISDFKRILKHRGQSEGFNPLDPPRNWLRNALKFAAVPLDRYGKRRVRDEY